MYVCIIMEYYKLGDMDRVLKQKRRSKEHIEELVHTICVITCRNMHCFCSLIMIYVLLL